MTRKHVAEYPVTAVCDHHVIRMPEGAQILTVSGRDGWLGVSVWALVDPDAPTHDRYFLVVQAGTPIDHVDKFAYVGSFETAARHFDVFEGPRWTLVLKPEIRRAFNVKPADVCGATFDSGSLMLPACVPWGARLADHYRPTVDDITCDYCLTGRVRPSDWLTRTTETD